MKRPLIGITADFDQSGPRAPHSLLYASYHDAIARHGGLPVMLPPSDPPDAIDDLLDRLDGVVFSGGDDLHPRHYGQPLIPEITLLAPRREAFELALARSLLAREIPLLGVCNGIQVINVAAGGTLVAHLPGADPALLVHKVPRPAQAFHRVYLEPGSRLREIAGAGEIRTNTYHHQSVDAAGAGVVIAGRAADGVVEAIELPDHPFAAGVQWHPEKMDGDPVQSRLLAAFLEAATLLRSVRRRRRVADPGALP